MASGIKEYAPFFLGFLCVCLINFYGILGWISACKHDLNSFIDSCRNKVRFGNFAASVTYLVHLDIFYSDLGFLGVEVRVFRKERCIFLSSSFLESRDSGYIVGYS